jgi:cytoskeletal protein RodZ
MRMNGKHTKRVTRLMGMMILGIILWLYVWVPIGFTASNYQTVPTMPPPTRSLTLTSTLGPQPTVSPTYPLATGTLATVTASPVATGRAATDTAAAAETMIAATRNPISSLTDVASNTAEISPAITLGATAIVPSLTTPTQGISGAPGGVVGLYICFGVGFVLVVAILIGVGLYRRSKAVS